jgi:hypothetical protein
MLLPILVKSCSRGASQQLESTMKKTLIGTFAAALLAFGASPAAADIIFDKTLGISAQGFGAAPRLLTVQLGGAGTESGCASDNGGTLALGSGSCIADASVTDGNGYTNLGGNEHNGPTNSLGDLSGFTDANQIVITRLSSFTIRHRLGIFPAPTFKTSRSSFMTRAAI